MGQLLEIENYTLKFDKAADIIYFHRTGEIRLDSQLNSRRSAIDGFFKVVQRRKAVKIRRKKKNDKVLASLGIVPGKKNQKVPPSPPPGANNND